MGSAEVRIGRMRRHLLMTEGNVLNSETVASVDQRVIRVTALTEDSSYTLLFETLRHEHRAGHIPWFSSLGKDTFPRSLSTCRAILASTSPSVNGVTVLHLLRV
jgi:hypothetical protein